MKRNGMTARQQNGAPLERSQVLAHLVDQLDALRLLEAIYGYLNDEGCAVVALANDPTPSERDAIWSIEWDFLTKYPEVPLDLRVIPRRDRPVDEVFQDDGSAIITRLRMSA